jgi:hypothetical protein
MAVYDTTTGDIVFLAEQPYVYGENSHGSCVVVGNRIYSQAGPTMACISTNLTPTKVDTQTSYLGGSNPWNGEKIIVEYNSTEPSGTGKTNIWSAWGGWEVFSSVIFSGIGNDARVYSGSESYGMTCWAANDGTPVSWYTTEGGLGGSPAIWDGKLYFGSQDNNVYCFEDHPTKTMSISVSADKVQLSGANQDITVTAQLTGAPNPEMQFTEATARGAYKGNPPLTGATVLVTFTNPDGVDTQLTATTDENGMASWTHTLNKEGTWKVMTWYEGEDHATWSWGYAFSDQLSITVGQPSDGNNGNTDGNNNGSTDGNGDGETTGIPMEYIYAIVGIVVVAVIAVVAYMYLKKRK